MKLTLNVLGWAEGVLFAILLAGFVFPPSTPYLFPKLVGALMALGGSLYLFIWGVSSSDPPHHKLRVGIPGLILVVIFLSGVFWYFEFREQQDLLKFHDDEIVVLTNADLKKRAYKLIDNLKDYDVSREEALIAIMNSITTRVYPNDPQGRHRIFFEDGNRLGAEGERQNAIWRRDFWPQVLGIIRVVRQRVTVPIPEPDTSVSAALEAGTLVGGIAPASAVAAYLETVVATLPPD